MQQFRKALLMLVLVLVALPSAAGACAALFSPEGQVRQSAQRIIFAIDRPRGLVEAYIAVNYVGAAEDFAWIIPLPSNPKVDVARRESFDVLERATNPRFRFPPDSCPELRLGGAPEAGAIPPGSVNVLQQGQIGPYDFSVIGGDTGVALSGWLRDNGYRVTQSMEPLIASYSDAGMVFLAMKLRGGQDVGDITPVKLTFAAEKAMIPLRLAAVGAEPGTELLVWIFAESQAVPENMQRLTIPDQQVVLRGRYSGDTYADAVGAALAAAGGRGLVTEASQPTSALEVVDDPLITDLSNRFAQFTRLYGRFDPAQMTIDPVFATEGGLADIPITRDLSATRMNPYDCRTGEVLPPAEQLAAIGSPQALWIMNRWIVPYLLAAALLIGGVTLAVRWRGVRR